MFFNGKKPLKKLKLSLVKIKKIKMDFDFKKFINYSLNNLDDVEYTQLGNGSTFFIAKIKEDDNHKKLYYLNKFNNDAEYLTDLLLKIRDKSVRYKNYLDSREDVSDSAFEAYCHNIYVYKYLMGQLYHISKKLKIRINSTIKSDLSNNMVELKADGDEIKWYVDYAKLVLGLDKYSNVHILDAQNGYTSPYISDEDD